MQKPAIAGEASSPPSRRGPNASPVNRGYPRLNAASSSVTSRIASARALSGRLLPAFARHGGDDRGHELFRLGADRGRQGAKTARARELDQPARDAGRIDDAGLAQVLGEAVRIGRGLWVAEPRSEAGGGPVRGRRPQEGPEGLFPPRAGRI